LALRSIRRGKEGKGGPLRIPQKKGGLDDGVLWEYPFKKGIIGGRRLS